MMRRAATALLAILLSACGPAAETGPAAPELVAAVRQAYIDIDWLTALDLAREAARLHPDDPEVAVWNARLLTSLNVLDEAVVAGDRAVELAPENLQAWEARLQAYAWGGIYRGNRDWLAVAMDIAPQAIRQFPDSPRLYRLASAAAGSGLSKPELYSSMLAELARDLDGSPLFRYIHQRDQLDTAQRARDDARVAEIQATMREELEELAARTETPLSTLELYRLAYGFQALEDEETADRWLEALQADPDGAPLAANLVSYRIAMQMFQSEGSLESKLELLEQQRAAFDSQWFVDHGELQGRYAATWDREVGLLSDALRQGEVEDPELQERYARRLAELVERLSRAGTGFGAWTLVQAGDALTETGLQPELALALADDGLEALDSARPGFMYPGNREDEAARRATEFRASFLRWRGVAKVRLGDEAAGKTNLLAAVEVRPSGQNYLALGDYHRAAGRPAEAYDAYLSAQAWGMPSYLPHLRDTATTRATEVLGELGRDDAELETDLEARVAEVDVAKREEAVGDPLGRAAPDFELTDMNDKVWRLSELRGSVVVLNFWATWCGPCRAEMPYYTALIDEYADQEDVIFLAISQDEGTPEIVEYLAENDYDFIVLMDDGIGNDYHVTGVPTHFMVGKNGLMQYATTGFSGPDSYNREMRWRIDALREGLER